MEKVIHTANPVATEPAPQMPPAPVVKKIITEESKMKKFIPIIIAVLVVLAGVMSGKTMASGKSGSSSQTPSGVAVGDDKVGSDNEVGIDDSETFKDTAEGTLVEGGIDGEGTHHLDRDLGETKYVYLTSTAINLDNFIGKKIQVWGQTIAGKKAGWLMDVGRVKVLE